ncbi:MAG: PcfJ domain-containing protein [Ruminococcus sp.]|nr:PcfJ domain-containing protein [Ruminococcus sp.]
MGNFVNVEAYMDGIKEYMPQFVFYRRGKASPTIQLLDIEFGEQNRKATDCYCTNCHERYTDYDRVPDTYKHKTKGTCHNCGAPVEYREMFRGRKNYYYKWNFCVFEGAGDMMRISCIVVSQRFNEEELEPDYDWYEVTRYELGPHRAVQYLQYWRDIKGEGHGGYVWDKRKSRPSMPNFNPAGFYSRPYGYTLINYDSVDNSFLRYIDKELRENTLPSNYIEWLCRCAEHPQIEYFIKAGLHCLAENYVYGRLGHTYINWRSNDLKKVLRLSKTELKYFAETDAGEKYSAYIRFRRDYFKGKSPEETIKYFDSFSHCMLLMDILRKLSGLSNKQIMDYSLKKMNREGGVFFMTCWRDYLNECQTLNYDMKDDAVLRPKDLFAAHERTSGIIKAEHDRLVQEQLAALTLERVDMECTDLELGLLIRQPHAVEEIAAEGAALSHCVGGYAQRHAEGKLTILFLRKISEPDKPYYTIEVSNDLKIVQCRGYKNNLAKNPKPEEISVFESRYQKYLDCIKAKRKKEAQRAKRKQRKMIAA